MRLRDSSQPELDFEFGLPSGREAFSVRFLASWFGTTPQHWINQIEAGTLPAANLASSGTSKKMWRIPRTALVTYLRKVNSMENL